MTGVAIVGPGAIGDVHAQALARLGVTPVAVAGPKPDELAAFASTHGVARTYGALDDLLADDDVEAVIVATPSHLHASQSVAVLESGRHVLCEIPVGLSASDAAAVADAAARAGRVAAVGHTLRYWEPHRRLQDRLESTGTLPSLVVVRQLMLRQTDMGWTGKLRDWTDSALWHHGGHAVDAALWHLRPAEPVTVTGTAAPPWPGSGSPMDVAGAFVTADGRLASVAVSYHSREAVSDFLVIAPERTLLVNGAVLRENGEVVYDGGDVATVQFDAVTAQDRAFLDAVAGGPPPAVQAADILPAARVLATLEAGALST
ncbi:Gfo/Idh/MocA family protein [Jiangella mangrovi]|uniref:2-hydroxy-4-carboxymuconate semialdehyde hemiacetal dehydrogenase n=1 Tax=Jiangella mangrovi TaxID=1524084 RepID=A0A7W9LPC8_9ACTN|nr:Gfo/Idh/MocA family oxidoreductase [Jiangella mangrovi]MBB5791171.1 2-hydroxy-4-carboxymuconate semialdehyde hemiacetal dehydrogenase [Jiangella mangrovi]